MEEAESILLRMNSVSWPEDHGYMARNHAGLVENVKNTMGISGRVPNLYLALSEFLINKDAEEALGKRSYEIAAAWVDFDPGD